MQKKIHIFSIACLGQESMHNKHPIHFSNDNSKRLSMLKCRASVGQRDMQAPQSIHLSSSTMTLPFLFTTTSFLCKASVMIFILFSGTSNKKFTPLVPVENFRMLNVISYFKISFMIFE